MKINSRDFELRKVKIAFVLPNLKGEGAEKTILNLFSNLDRNKFEITLILASKKGEYIDFFAIRC